jgi:hypothetical protein
MSYKRYDSWKQHEPPKKPEPTKTKVDWKININGADIAISYVWEEDGQRWCQTSRIAGGIAFSTHYRLSGGQV